MRREILIHRGDSPSLLLSTVKEFIGEYPKGVVVTVEPWCEPRTKAQNAQYQLWVKRISAQTGIRSDELKRMAKDDAVGFGYPVERDEDGEPIMQYGSCIPKSTKDVTIGQMKILMRSLRNIALEHDVVLEDTKG